MKPGEDDKMNGVKVSYHMKNGHIIHVTMDRTIVPFIIATYQCFLDYGGWQCGISLSGDDGPSPSVFAVNYADVSVILVEGMTISQDELFRIRKEYLAGEENKGP